MKVFIKAIWELPQNVLGFIIKNVCRATPYTTYKDANVYSWNVESGMSLGRYIFVPFKFEDTTTNEVQRLVKHEYGHTIQSKYLGWFYLLVIGLPSIVWAGCFEQYRQKTGINYYDFFTESWADKLGGVER